MKIDDLYQFQVKHYEWAHGRILDALECLSLDACVPFYRKQLFLPLTIPDDFRFVLQKNLKEYTYLKGEDDEWINHIVNVCLADVSIKYGDQASRHLGMWTAIVSDHFGYGVLRDIWSDIIDTDRYKLSLAIPRALDRFYPLWEFIDATMPEDWETVLVPGSLKTSWDKKLYAKHYDARPDEECNTWEPNVNVSLMQTHMCRLLVWETIARSFTDAEFNEVNKWIVEVEKMMGYSGKEWRDVRKLLMPEELRRYYDEQGLLLKYPPK